MIEGMAADWKAGHRAAVKALFMPLADLDAFDSCVSEQQVRTQRSGFRAQPRSSRTSRSRQSSESERECGPRLRWPRL